MKKILSFGELILRINLDEEGAWLNNKLFPFFIGGAELNVASALALWDIPSVYVTAMPENNLGKQIMKAVAQRGVDVSDVYPSGNKVALYYLSAGSDLKSAEVIYDRQQSSFSTLRTGVLNWDELFEDVSFFHFSAICPALSQALAEVCEEALYEARKRNIKISIDLNYRKKLWDYVDTPIEIMSSLLKSCTIVMGNIWAAHDMLGISIDASAVEQGNKAGYQEAARKSSLALMKEFPACTVVANTFRFKTEEGLQYYSCLYSEGELYTSKEYFAKEVLDMVGSGDCYMAGLLYGMYKKLSLQDTVDFATAAAFSKLFIHDDVTHLGISALKEFVRPYEVSTSLVST